MGFIRYMPSPDYPASVVLFQLHGGIYGQSYASRETGLIQLTRGQERILNQTYNEIMVIIGAQGWRRKCSDSNLTVTPDRMID